MAFTVVFKGNVKHFFGNPMEADTPFGKPQAMSYGNSFDAADILRAALEQIAADERNPVDIAEKALAEVDDLMMAEIKAIQAS